MNISISKVIGAIVVSNLAGAVGSLFTFSAIPNWYGGLIKPELNPPNWLFGPVWTTLYILMGISAGIIWSYGFKKTEIKIAMVIFLVQLVLNAFWSIIFFGWQNLGLALIEILVLWVFILINIILFYKINSIAGYLLIPYILWVSIATYLNFSLWQLN